MPRARTSLLLLAAACARLSGASGPAIDAVEPTGAYRGDAVRIRILGSLGYGFFICILLYRLKEQANRSRCVSSIEKSYPPRGFLRKRWLTRLRLSHSRRRAFRNQSEGDKRQKNGSGKRLCQFKDHIRFYPFGKK